MALQNCPECAGQVSSASVACPHCGYPLQATPASPACYACAATATTRCQCCGVLSCAVHLQNIYVPHGRGGAYELRCERCYASANVTKVLGWVVAGIVVLVVTFIWLSRRH